jgi:hypothetical protein
VGPAWTLRGQAGTTCRAKRAGPDGGTPLAAEHEQLRRVLAGSARRGGRPRVEHGRVSVAGARARPRRRDLLPGRRRIVVRLVEVPDVVQRVAAGVPPAVDEHPQLVGAEACGLLDDPRRMLAPLGRLRRARGERHGLRAPRVVRVHGHVPRPPQVVGRLSRPVDPPERHDHAAAIFPDLLLSRRDRDVVSEPRQVDGRRIQVRRFRWPVWEPAQPERSQLPERSRAVRRALPAQHRHLEVLEPRIRDHAPIAEVGEDRVPAVVAHRVVLLRHPLARRGPQVRLVRVERRDLGRADLAVHPGRRPPGDEQPAVMQVYVAGAKFILGWGDQEPAMGRVEAKGLPGRPARVAPYPHRILAVPVDDQRAVARRRLPAQDRHMRSADRMDLTRRAVDASHRERSVPAPGRGVAGVHRADCASQRQRSRAECRQSFRVGGWVGGWVGG